MANEIGPQKGDKTGHYLASSINLIPIIGGMLHALAVEHIPNKRVERLERFTQQLAEDIEASQERIKEDYVQTEEFAFIFEQVYRKVSENFSTEKIEGFRNILINCLTTQPDVDRTINMLKAIDDLTSTDILVLKQFLKSDEQINSEVGGMGDIMGTLLGTIQRLLPEFKEQDIQDSIRKLDQLNITHGVANSLRTMMTGPGSISLSGRLTSFGNQFINFVLRKV